MSTKFTKSSKQPVNIFDRLTEAVNDPGRVLQHQPIGGFTNTGVGGVAEYLVVVEKLEELLNVLRTAIETHLPYVVLGGGSGVVTSSVGFPGLVIINRSNAVTFLESDGEVIAESGASNELLVNAIASRGYSGLEHLSLVPGTIGGAIASQAEWGGQTAYACLREAVIFIPNSDRGETARVAVTELQANHHHYFTDTNYGPVILSLRFRVRQLSEDEVRRRLAEIRRNQIDRGDTLLGGIFTPAPDASVWDRGRRLVPKGLHLNRRQPNYLFGKKGFASPETLRSTIDKLQSTLVENGYQGERRLRYIGYWPKKENDVVDSPNT